MPAPSAPFVGRATELDELVAGVEQARAGVPDVVLLSGEAGVGKSRLIAEVVALATGSGAAVLTGSCLDAAEAHLPYLPFTEVVAGMRAFRPGLAEEFRRSRRCSRATGRPPVRWASSRCSTRCTASSWRWRAAARAVECGLTWALYGVQSRMMLDVVRGMTGDWAPVLAGTDERSVAAALPVLVAAGRTEDADRHLAALGEQPAGAVDEDAALLGGVAGCERELWCGRPDAAARWTDRALAGLDAAGSSWQVARIRPAALGLTAAADTAEAARRAGRPVETGRGDDLHALVHASAASVVRPHGPEALAWMAWADAEHTRLGGRVDDVEGWRARAVVAAFDYGDVYPQACARRRLATALLATGDRDGAATALCSALDTAERLGAVPLAAAVRATAGHGGLRLAGEQAPPSGLLTPREHSVLALVAEGGTNRQVGEALYISEKTVSVPLTRVMAKLGAANRTEAVRLAYERGLLSTTPPVRTPR